MNLAVLISAFLVPFAATFLCIPLVRRIAIRKGWVDRPDQERKRHPKPTPNVGGIAIMVGCGIGLLLFFLADAVLPFHLGMPRTAFLVGGLIIICTGIFDDLYKIGFKQKILIQVIVAYLLIHQGLRFDVTGLPFISEDPYNQTLYSAALTMLWIIGVINAINLIDGLDGLAGGVSIIAFACLALVFGTMGDLRLVAVALLMIGALAGFLIHNFNPASIFMGDSGSLFVGYMLAGIVLDEKIHPDPLLAILVPIVALGLPLLDTLLAFVRRLLAGKSPFAPDHDHIHHRLSSLFPTRRAVLILYGVALWFGLAAFLMSRLELPYGLAIAGLTLVTAFIGMRTLGYLDMKRMTLRTASSAQPGQLSFDFESVPEPYAPARNGHLYLPDSRLLRQPQWVVVSNGPAANGEHKAAWYPVPEKVGPTVSVIVPVHNGGEAFVKCLEALTTAVPSPDEIIVVAEGETDGAWRNALNADVLVLKYETAKGPAYARNIGAEAASGDVLLFIDADVTITPDVIGRVKDAFGSDPKLSGLIGSYDAAPADQRFLSQYRNLLHHHVHQTSVAETSTFWGACGAIRRDVFFSVGGFSESYNRPCIEDIELGYRLRQKGEKVRIFKDIQVKHFKRWTARSMVKTDFFDRALPWTELIFRYQKLENNLNLDPSSRLSVLSVFALVGALVASLWYTPALALAVVMAGLLLVLNAPFYGFLLRTRGFWFTLGAIPWHWFFYVYGGTAFLIGTVRNLHTLAKDPAPARRQHTPMFVPDLPDLDIGTTFAREADLVSMDVSSTQR